MSNNLIYLYVKFVKDYLKEKVEVLKKLKISLFKRKINKGIEEDKK